MQERVARLPWRLALAAAAVTAVATVCAAIAGMGDIPGVVHLVLLAAVALPLLSGAAPAAFCRACLLVGTTLLWVSILGARFGLWPVLLASLLLLAASVADRANPPGCASMALAGMLPPVFLLVGFCLAPF